MDAPRPYAGDARVFDPRAEIGAFLRTRRARLRPEEVGLPVYGRYRRVPGLRREELAQLAGVSVAYLTRLEQGRGQNVSAEVLGALSRALRLTDAEHEHLTRLAKCHRTNRRTTPPPHEERVRPALREMLMSLDGLPAYVTGWRSDLLAWNRTATALFGDWDRLPPRDRNWARLLFLRPGSRSLFKDWETQAATTVSTLRLHAGCRPDDPRLLSLVDELTAGSDDFRRFWSQHDIEENHHGTTRLHHPLVGELTLSFETLQLPDGSDQTLTIHHAQRPSPAWENLRLLTSWGTAAPTPIPHP
ncbi:helix-turn-helix transcriptional regulator [Streptomyces sp. NPDC058653]|uniref:helix-turn-helix transcriptional regulator n=1 Tax=Streptomyces sp. NPDC058653 TaxID=3346576 RepID=UPI0036595531